MIEIKSQHKNVCKCAAKAIGRYTLNFAFVDQVGPCLVATDGRRLVALSADFAADASDPHDFVVPPAAIDDAAKRIAKKPKFANGWRVELRNGEAGSVRVVAPDGETKMEAAEGSFPKWRDIVPRPDRIKATVTLDATLLRGLLDAVDAGERPQTQGWFTAWRKERGEYGRVRFVPILAVYRGDEDRAPHGLIRLEDDDFAAASALAGRDMKPWAMSWREVAE